MPGCLDVIWLLLGALFLLDGLRIRGRLQRIVSWTLADASTGEGYRCVVADNVVPQSVVAQMVAQMEKKGSLCGIGTLVCALILAWSVGCHVDASAEHGGTDSAAHAFIGPRSVLTLLANGEPKTRAVL